MFKTIVLETDSRRLKERMKEALRDGYLHVEPNRLRKGQEEILFVFMDVSVSWEKIAGLRADAVDMYSVIQELDRLKARMLVEAGRMIAAVPERRLVTPELVDKFREARLERSPCDTTRSSSGGDQSTGGGSPGALVA